MTNFPMGHSAVHCCSAFHFSVDRTGEQLYRSAMLADVQN